MHTSSALSEAAVEGLTAASLTEKSAWRAQLCLTFARRDARTVLASRAHSGPLLVQRPLYEEGEGVCQVVVVHPPGGIAGGDRLSIEAEVLEGAHALLTMPGAAKWYRSVGPWASQAVSMRIARGGVVEWLPQEAILFSGARAALRSRIELTGDAVFVGWEVTCFGRTASGERFEAGHLSQITEITHEGRPLFGEYAQLPGASPLLVSRVGLAGYPVSATMLIAGRDPSRELLDAMRAVMPSDDGLAGVTTLPGVTVARLLGRSAQAARWYFQALWTLARPALVGRRAAPPRIWRC
jgi:urease accessory protein